MTIFIAEDDFDDRELIQEAFLSRGISPVIFDDGLELTEYLKKHSTSPIAILTDLNMPKMNGFEVLDIVRKCPINSKIPFFIYSSNPTQASKNAAKLLGVTYFYGKPFNGEAYSKMAEDILERADKGVKVI